MDRLKYFLRDDIYSELLFGVTVLSSPFVSIGYNGNDTVLYISLAVGVLSLLGLIARVAWCVINRTSTGNSPLVFAFLELLFPYSIALSAYIAAGETGPDREAMWFAAFLCLLILIEHLIPKRIS